MPVRCVSLQGLAHVATNGGCGTRLLVAVAAPNSERHTGQGVTMLQQAPVEQAREALDDARHLRARNLLRVTNGEQRALDVILSAREAGGVALRQIKLRQLLLAQPGVGRQRADAFLSAVASTLETSADLGSKNISWLIDPRSGGRRFLCWLDASTRQTAPWPGFPCAPNPYLKAPYQ